ncbi:UvrD-helicase domain-containing protein [Massilibacteroides sp.]|uniref:UvrD-helicase domain-containing protein n=1 Tax=Massilibacteroides sp. TaxID=2034766 RepID=UPI00261894AD|nr:UvrD-helicase domain-containing protein [Massilibacteroides sp.]MDD4516180.1 UvrD-helicase domain-containing protein [Massilibacteroides sp.]
MLTVYRASAGAGKTHKLTGEYLKLLFTHPAAYRRILAVTFTNKATDEMKNRIVEELHVLASGKKSSFLKMLSDANNLQEATVRTEAKRILIRILHDYAAFNISTIDRFFQQTMRAFTREIGLQGGYGIEMDQNLVLTEAVDNLLNDLERPENKDLLNWLLRFAEDKIENGGEWNLRREIMILAQEIFKENYKALSADVTKDLENKEALEKYKEELSKIVRSVEAEAKKLGEKGLALMDQYGLQPADFKGGSRSAMFYFQKLANGEMKEPTATFSGFADNPEGCYTKTTPVATQQIIACVMDEGLNDCIKSILSLFGNLSAYYTAREITRYYYTLGILTDISRQIAAYREKKNILLIADTTELLNKIIAGSDTPFIYEKTGTRVDHYMIDEFQDTSKMQWDNFRPLLKESLAQAYSNLIVGDVKQSIYRFRNSDWTLLDSQVQQDFSPSELEEETLKENWRSLQHVVDFNNSFFSIAPSLLQAQYNEQVEASTLSEDERAEYVTRINKAYGESTQLVPDILSGDVGHVQIAFLPQNEETDWKEEALSRLPETIEHLQKNGYQLKDIAILVRTNREGATVAEMLLEYKEAHPDSIYKYDIISDDSLFVNSSPAVRFIISILKHLKHPDDQTHKQLALFSYIALVHNFEEPVIQNSFPEETEKALQALSRSSLYEMTEGIYRLFADRFPENEHVFIQAFLDLVLEFTQKESADAGSFLRWWDDSGIKKTIATPNEQDAIRIMTIHKSKGLGFKAVILPFGDWEIDHKPTKSVILWCHPTITPFDRLHLVPVRYGQILANTYFAKDYFKEKLHAFIDNLNTLYVAFTRAKEELIVFAPRPKKAEANGEGVNRANSIADLLWISLCRDELSAMFQPEEGLFETGKWYTTSYPEKPNDIKELSASSFHSISSEDRLHLRLRGKNLRFDDEQRKYGALMHDLLSLIYTHDDILPAIESYYQAGIINRTEVEQLQKQLNRSLNGTEVRSWFDGSFHTLNETDILFGKGLAKRPDRVMIKDGEVVVVDYKFGEIEEKKYSKQIKSYVDLIKAIGYKQVYGYIWYVELNKLVCVKE